jgi:hypothetical protein
MSEYTTTPSPKKTRISTRRQGVRLTTAQRIEAQAAFLKSFANAGNVRAACMAANVDRSTVRQWEEHDTDFSLKYGQSKLDVDDAIRGEIYRRGMFGEEKIVVSMGKVVYDKDGKPMTTREKSDTLLIFHAKARMPEYREKQEVTHSGSIDVSGAKEELLRRLTELEARHD